MIVAVLGLGEAGARIAVDLVAAGCTVHGWGPARKLDGVVNAESAAAAVRGTDVVLSVNAASAALAAASEVGPALEADALYVDLNTASPQLKRELAASLPVQFADVALVGVVPDTGLATAALASGAGADRFAELFRPLGMPVEVVGADPGDAAGLKLLRSVFMKGVAAAALESLEAARAVGAEDRVRGEIAALIGEPLLERLLEGSQEHAARRVDEMRAAAAYLDELDVDPRVALVARTAPRRGLEAEDGAAPASASAPPLSRTRRGALREPTGLACGARSGCRRQGGVPFRRRRQRRSGRRPS